MDDNTFIFCEEWIDNVEDLPVEIQDKALGDIARYGCGRPMLYADIPEIHSHVKPAMKRIRTSLAKYHGRVQATKDNKSKRKASDEEVWMYAREHKPCKAAEVAAYFGVSKSTIDHNEGWR